MRRAAIVAAARGWIGTPYAHQASFKQVGCDCLGLLRGVWREVVGPEPESPPPYRRAWAEPGRDMLQAAAQRHLVPATGLLRAGDVILFRWRAHLPAKHCAIIGAEAPPTMIHAHDGASVAEVALAPFWARHLAGHFVFPGLDEAASGPEER